MFTKHAIHTQDAKSFSIDQAHLIVTSPPYPMIEMWDSLFGNTSYTSQHEVLNQVWKECHRVLCPGGILCINVGDACRTIEGRFEYYPNHSTITEFCRSLGFITLPPIHWRKPTNKPNKFMGSGMLPPNAYVTLEEEAILIFRKPGKRNIEPAIRHESAYFWHERNKWFCDSWDIRGSRQSNPLCPAVFPLEIPLRLINMYSCYGDLVVDPFCGTSTTLVAAALAGRNSVGYDTTPEMTKVFDERFASLPAMSEAYLGRRLDEQKKSVEGRDTKYKSNHYHISVITGQEKDILFYKVTDYQDNIVQYEPYQ